VRDGPLRVILVEIGGTEAVAQQGRVLAASQHRLEILDQTHELYSSLVSVFNGGQGETNPALRPPDLWRGGGLD
jgi:hypothetical protein